MVDFSYLSPKELTYLWILIPSTIAYAIFWIRGIYRMSSIEKRVGAYKFGALISGLIVIALCCAGVATIIWELSVIVLLVMFLLMGVCGIIIAHGNKALLKQHSLDLSSDLSPKRKEAIQEAYEVLYPLSIILIFISSISIAFLFW